MRVVYFQSEDEDDDTESEDTFHEIEKIIQHKHKDGRVLYLVKWKHFDAAFNSWVDIDALSTADIILDEYYMDIINSQAKND